MKAAILFTGGGPLAVLTSHPSLEAPDVLDRLRSKGVEKFMAFEVPEAVARDRYGPHFTRVMEDLRQSDELRVLDDNGERIFALFSFAEWGPAMAHEAGPGPRPVPPDPAAMI